MSSRSKLARIARLARGAALVVTCAVLLFGSVAPALAAPTITFTGRGWGHGIGMGQWGAYGMAKRGRTPAGHTASGPNIVAHYFPGTQVGSTPTKWVSVNIDKNAKYSRSSSGYNAGYTRSSWRIRAGHVGGTIRADGKTYPDGVHTIKAFREAPNRIAHADRYTTAVEISKDIFPAGSSPKAIVFASGDDAKFADSLTAAGLAGTAGGSTLLVQQNRVSNSTMLEARRLKQLGATSVYVVGGPRTVSNGVKATIERSLGLPVVRIGGADRYAVAAGVAREMVALGASGKEVLIASGVVWPDAALAASVAAGTGRPVLLVGKHMPAVTAHVLDELETSSTIVFGGPNTIPDSVARRLDPAPAERFGMWGDRFTLAAQVASWLAAEEGFKLDNIFVVTAERFPDSITGGVLAGAKKQPMLLTWQSEAPPGTTNFVRKYKSVIDEVTIIGGKASVGPGASDDVCRPLGIGVWKLSLDGKVDLGATTEVKEVAGGSPGLVQVVDKSGPFDHSYIRHRGYLIFSVNDKGKVKCLAKMPLENYLYGVVPREMPSGWHPEALRAQAIAARSYAYTTTGELYCTVSSQVYNGHSKGSNRATAALHETANSAVDSTKGLVVKYRGAIVRTYFHSSSGGHTADLADVWLKPDRDAYMASHPYYNGVPDPYGSTVGDTHIPWSPAVKMNALTAAAKLAPRISGEPSGAGKSIYIKKISVNRASSGHVRYANIQWSNGAWTYGVSGATIRSALGLKSTVFYVAISG